MPTVFLVDDEADHLLGIRYLLEDRGHDVEVFYTADAAYENLTNRKDESIGALLIDLTLSPGARYNEIFTEADTANYLYTGRTLAEQLLKSDRKQFEKKIAILTGAWTIDDRTRRFVELENIPILTKRPDPHSLISEIEELFLK